MATISTTSPPVAEPRRYSGTLTTSFATIIAVDDYSVTRTVAGVPQTATVGGVAEITSPLLLCNRTGTAQWASVQIVREDAAQSVLMHQVTVPAGETLAVPLNGQFLLTGDVLQVRAEAGSAIDATVSWTQGEAEGDGSV
jgi:hypothetical protein